MKEHEFHSLADAGYTRIPLIREVLADLDTPLSTYLKLARGPRSFLFESVEGGEKWGRYSIIGLPARTEIAVYGHRIEVHRDGVQVDEEEVVDPLAWIEAYQHRHRAAPPSGFPQMPRFLGGLVGYFGYDTVRYVEPRLAGNAPADALGLPDICLVEAEEVVVFDNLAGRLYLVVHCDPREAGAYEHGLARLDELAERLAEPLARLGAEVTGLDASEETIKAAKAHAQVQGLGIDYRCTSAEALARTDERFDAVLAMEVVEHVADRDAFLRACGELVRPGGLCVLATINRTRRSFLLAKVAAEYILGWLPRGTHDWHSFVRPSELAAGLRPTGLRVRELTGVAFDPRTGGWKLSPSPAVNYMLVAVKP